MWLRWLVIAWVALQEASNDVVVAVSFAADEIKPALCVVLHLDCCDALQLDSTIAIGAVDTIFMVSLE